MKILVVDPICPRGHVNFDTIQIAALKKLDCKIDYIFKGEFGEKIGISDSEIVLKLSKNNNRKSKLDNFIFNRIKAVKDYLKIRKYLKNNKYNAIIFLSFDEMLIPLIGRYPKVFLFNHTNVAGIEKSSIKRYLYVQYSRCFTQLVFEEDSYNFLDSIDIRNKKIIPHGLVKSFEPEISLQEFSKYRYIIFSPSRGSIDEQLCNGIINNKSFLNFLDTHNILFILRSEILTSNNPNVKILRGHLNTDYYECLFCLASLIFVPYTSKFRYRTSGVIMGGIANDKNLLLIDIPAFRAYEKYIGEESYFNSHNYLDKFKYIISQLDRNEMIPEYTNKVLLQPDYSFLIDAKSND